MISYDKLLFFLKQNVKYKASFKPNYLVINIPKSRYHISVFKDQWNDYESTTDLPYHLFHVSSDEIENRCSSYFWADKKTYQIKKIPDKYFKYEQPDYNFYQSRRKPCDYKQIKHLLTMFHEILKHVMNTDI